MDIIAHRINTVALLESTDKNYGVEIDLRSKGQQLIIHHDPYVDGELFDDWIKYFNHGTLILNVKEEGLEDQLLAVLAKYGIENFFFLDQSFPFIIKTSLLGERRCAVRVSEFESVDTALSLSQRADWVWVDCFSEFTLSSFDYARLKTAGFKICIVSPELQGRDAESEIPELADLLLKRNISPDAVCTKRPELWGKIP